MTALVPVSPGGLAVMEFDQGQIDLVKRTIMPGASNDELQLFLATCRRLQLDPFARQIYAVKRWNAEERCFKFVTQVSIDGFRVVASRSGDYQGQDGPQWCGADGVWRDVWLEKTPPAASRVGVWRKGFKQPAWGIARFESYVQKTKDGQPNKMWSTMPDVMLSKCAESLALRKAFPNDLSGIYTREEMGQSEADTVEAEVESVAASRPAAPVDAPRAVVDFPIDETPLEDVSLRRLRAALQRIYPGDTPDALMQQQAWAQRAMRVEKVRKGRNIFDMFEGGTYDQRLFVIKEAEAYEEQSRPPGWMGGAPVTAEEAEAIRKDETSAKGESK